VPDVLHDEIVEAAFAFDAVDRNDVGVVELRGGLCFLLEPLHDVLVHRDVGRQHLDRDFALEREIVRQVHGAHPAFAEQALDLVFAFDQALQPRLETFRGGARAQGAAARDVGAAREAELAAVRQRRVTLQALHHGARRSAHGRRRFTNSEFSRPSLAREAAGSLVRLDVPITAGAGAMRGQVFSPNAGIIRMHIE